MPTKRPFDKVLIVGAGPAGLLLALLLSQHGIPVSIVEASHELDQQPRAAHYGPPATPDLARAGILDELRARGMSMNTLCWRRTADEGHGYIAGFDGGVLADVDWNGQSGPGPRDCRTVSYPLQDLDALMLEKLVARHGEGVVRWRHKVVDVGQSEEQEKKKAWVDVETPEGRRRIEADYVVGCDGANSAVRRALFGNEFPGFTWEEQIIATNVSVSSGGVDAVC